MKTVLKAGLEAAIEKWLEECSENELIAQYYGIYIHDSLATEMASAAEAVFDCLVNFQEGQIGL